MNICTSNQVINILYVVKEESNQVLNILIYVYKFVFQDLSDVQKPNVEKPPTPPEIVERPATPEMYVEKENNDIAMVKSPEDIRQEESQFFLIFHVFSKQWLHFITCHL